MVIVEDESITALHLAKQLRSLGYQIVAQASSGPQAIQQALSLHPHVVLMDIHVHGPMDGVDAARHIQAAAPIPVVYMSAQADAATIERFQATTQAAGFVSKPIHLPTLYATLQRVCSRPEGDLPREGPFPASLSLWNEDSKPRLSWHVYCFVYVSIGSRRLQERTQTRRETP
jgi:CheY-like chemotaxis protein